MELLNQLKNNIRLELDMCDSNSTPYVCSQKSTKEGYYKIEKMIVDFVCGNAYSINEAISTIEKLYNPNKLD